MLYYVMWVSGEIPSANEEDFKNTNLRLLKFDQSRGRRAEPLPKL